MLGGLYARRPLLALIQSIQWLQSFRGTGRDTANFTAKQAIAPKVLLSAHA